MKQNSNTDELLRSYLLGEISGPEAERLERRLLAEDELFDLLEAIEAELLAAASRGELVPAERERVLRRLASSPEGRERLALARSLNDLADKKKAGMASVVPFRRREAGFKPVQWVALAAAGLMAAVGLFWFTQQTPHGGETASQIAHERPAPAQSRPHQESAPPVAQTPATPPMTETSPTPAPIAREKGTPIQAPEPVKAVFALALTSLRGDTEVEEFLLPSNAEIAEIQVDLEGLEPSGTFRVAVRNRDEGTIWDKKGLKAQKLDWGTALVLDIPADRLPPGRYEIAVTKGSEPEMTQELEIVREDR